MRRWLLTSTLAVSAIAALFFAPGLRSRSVALPIAAPADSAIAPGPLTLDAKLEEATWLSGSTDPRFLVLTVKAPADPTKSRVPVDLALVVDTSGSMGSGGKIQHAREAAARVVDALAPGDRFSLVSFDDDAHVLLPGAPFDGDRDRLLDVVSTLADHGGTNLYGGLAAARDQLGDGERVRRLLLVSDGNATAGITEPAAFEAFGRDAANAGITVSTLGLGADFDEVLLEGLADAGGGNYAFVEESSDLVTVAGREFEEATRVVARGAVVDVTLPAGVRIATVHGWPSTTRGEHLFVPIGDLAAGQERRIVLELDAPLTGDGPAPVASAALTYTLVDDGVQHGAWADATVRLTTDAAAAAASRDEATSVIVARARAGTLTSRAAEALRAGRMDEARDYNAHGFDVLTEEKQRLMQVIGDVEGGSRYAEDLEGDLRTQSHIAELSESGDVRTGAKAASAAAREMSR
jgi:Ca-activated chloride channel family protein